MKGKYGRRTPSTKQDSHCDDTPEPLVSYPSAEVNYHLFDHNFLALCLVYPSGNAVLRQLFVPILFIHYPNVDIGHALGSVPDDHHDPFAGD